MTADIADDLTYAMICQLAQPGDEFHSRHVKALMIIDYPSLQAELHRLRDLGMVVFTGKLCKWKRLR